MPNLTSIFSSWPSCVEGLNGARVKVNVLILYLASLHSQSRGLPFDGDGGGLRKRNGKTIVWPETQRGSWWESRFLINEGVIIYRRCWLTPFRSRNNVCDKGPILRKEQINERLWILWELALRGNEWCQPRRVWRRNWPTAAADHPLMNAAIVGFVLWKNNACNNSAFMPKF